MNVLRKHFFFLFSLFLFTGNIASQNKVIDSLANELLNHQQRDTARVRTLNEYAYKHYGIDQAKLEKYADESIALAGELKFYDGEARAWYLKSIFYLAKGDLENATTSINQSLNLYEKADNQIRVAACYDLMGSIGLYQEDYDSSIFYYQKALQTFKDANDPYKVAGVMANMGGVLSRKGDFDKAIETYKESIIIYDSINNINAKKKALVPLNNIALNYTQQGRHTEALAYFQRCLSGYREYGNKISGSALLINMASVYSSMEEHDKALPYLLEALELGKELGNDFSISKTLVGIGTIFQSKKEYGKAMEYYDEALTISNEIDSKEGKHNCYSRIGSLQLEKKEYNLALISFKKALEFSILLDGKREIAESYTALGKTYYYLKDNENAFTNALKGKELANELSILRTQQEANLLLSKLYEESGNSKKALAIFKTYKDLSDSLLNKESIQKITQLEYDYKYKQALDSASIRELKLTKTVETTSKDLEKSQRELLLGVIVFLIMTLLLGAIIFFLKLRNIKSRNQNIEIEQKLLRSQMTPHFIFNSLSVLQGMILNKEEGKSVNYLTKFSKLLRITLENSRGKMVSLSQELTAVENYLELQNIEVNDSYDYTILVDENIDKALFTVPPMLIQPFIENAIEHGFINQKDNRKIDVHLAYLNKQLICTIKDNGIGVDSQKQVKTEHKKSLATTITSERLEVLSQNSNTKGSIHIEDRRKHNEKGTIVTLMIPYKLSTV